jgi:RND family efflux transporter MFP subunit
MNRQAKKNNSDQFMKIRRTKHAAFCILLSSACAIGGAAALAQSGPARPPATPPAPAQPGKPATPAFKQQEPGPFGGSARPPMYAEQPLAEEVAVLIVATEETTLSSQMAGRIQRVRVGLGDTVARDAPLIEFDCSEQQAQQQSAQAEYRAARETHLTKLKLQALGAAGELEVTVAAASADKAKGQVDVREAQMAYCRVNAPFGGKVARLRVKAAESVSLGQPLIELVNPATLKAQMFVPASYIRTLKPGAPFQVRLENGQLYKASVAKLNSRVEGVSQQLEVEGRFEGSPAGLLPGMVGTAVFPGRR